MWPNPQKTVDLVILTEEILNGKIHFLCIEPSAPPPPPTSLMYGPLRKNFRAIFPTGKLKRLLKCKVVVMINKVLHRIVVKITSKNWEMSSG